MEAFAVAAAIPPLVRELYNLSRSLIKCARKIRYAAKETTRLARETRFFASTYRDFLRVVHMDKSKSFGTRPLRKLKEWAEDILHGLWDLLDKVRDLQIDIDSTNLPEMLEQAVANAKARFRWFFSTRAVKCMRSSMAVARQSMVCFTNLRQLEQLLETFRYLTKEAEEGTLSKEQEADMQEIKESIMTLKRNEKDDLEEQRILNDKLRDIRGAEDVDDTVPPMKGLESFSKAVRRYDEKVVSAIPPLPHKRKVETSSSSNASIRPSSIRRSHKPTVAPATIPPRTQPRRAEKKTRSPPAFIPPPAPTPPPEVRPLSIRKSVQQPPNTTTPDQPRYEVPEEASSEPVEPRRNTRYSMKLNLRLDPREGLTPPPSTSDINLPNDVISPGSLTTTTSSTTSSEASRNYNACGRQYWNDRSDILGHPRRIPPPDTSSTSGPSSSEAAAAAGLTSMSSLGEQVPTDGASNTNGKDEKFRPPSQLVSSNEDEIQVDDDVDRTEGDDDDVDAGGEHHSIEADLTETRQHDIDMEDDVESSPSADEEEASPFQPLTGRSGKFPPGWKAKRRRRDASTER